MTGHLAEGHIAAIQEAGGLAPILRAFLQRLPTWNPLNPDWQELERLLLVGYRLAPSELGDLTLVDIRRHLIGEPPLADKPKPLRKSRPRSQQKRSITKVQAEVLGMHLSGQSVAEIARHRNTSIQSTAKTLKSALKNQGSLVERSHRSARAANNTDRLEQRGRRRGHDDGSDGDDGQS